MNALTPTRSILILAILLVAGGTAHAQQVQGFEEKFVAGRPDASNLVPLPTLGIVPLATLSIEPDLSAQLTEAMQKELDRRQDGRFEVLTRQNAGKINWAFVVKNAPREVYDTLTPQFTDQLITCLHSLADDMNLGSLNALLQGAQPSDAEARDHASAAGAEMLVNWKADRCATRRNDLPSIDGNRTRLAAATHGMVTGTFDPLVFRSLGLIDLTVALGPLYLGSGGFWTTELAPQLHTRFDAAVGAGFLTTRQAPEIADRDLRTFWDWAILVTTTKASVVRSFSETTASRCVATVAELSTPFRLARCMSAGKLQFITLRVAGQDYSAVQMVRL